ncbi:MAG TPA: chemotaxis protein CheB [Methanospirillum sp.]|nr:chemotaxis protein CheB [Methanospirillum sp.]
MRIAVIGSSTGGPYILEKIFTNFPKIPAAIIIVQHLPLAFTKTFQTHISSLTSMAVNVASSGYSLHEGEILIAPSGKHLVLDHNRRVLLQDGEKVHGVKPAIDCTMLSLHSFTEDRLCGIVLTGMGQDGAAGVAHIRNLGGTTIAQDPGTSPIRSMPQAAIDTGKVLEVLAPEGIRQALISFGNF